MVIALLPWLGLTGCQDPPPADRGSTGPPGTPLPAVVPSSREHDLRAAVARADLVVVARRADRPSGADPAATPYGDRAIPYAIDEVLKGSPDVHGAPDGAREIHVLGPLLAATPALLFLTRDARSPNVVHPTGSPRIIAADPWGRAITWGPHGPVLLRVDDGGLARVIDGEDPYASLYPAIDAALSVAHAPGVDAAEVPLPPRPADSTPIPAQDFRDAVRAVRRLARSGADVPGP